MERHVPRAPPLSEHDSGSDVDPLVLRIMRQDGDSVEVRVEVLEFAVTFFDGSGMLHREIQFRYPLLLSYPDTLAEEVHAAEEVTGHGDSTPLNVLEEGRSAIVAFEKGRDLELRTHLPRYLEEQPLRVELRKEIPEFHGLFSRPRVRFAR